MSFNGVKLRGNTGRGRERGAPAGHFGALVMLALAALACGLTGSAGAPAVEAATPTVPGLPLAAEMADMTFAPVITMTPVLPTNTPRAADGDACHADEDEGAPIRYDVEARIDATAHTVAATMSVFYRNRTGRALNRLVFNVDANRTPDTFALDSLDAVPLDEQGAPPLAAVMGYELNGPRLDMALDRPLAPGCALRLAWRFSLNVPPLADARMKYFAFTPRQLNLGHWLPEVAPFVDGEWRTPDAWSIGEYTYADMADFAVRVTLTDGNPAKLEIIGPGEVTREDERTWVFILKRARSFTLAVSAGMSILSTKVENGPEIDLYTFVDGQATVDAEGNPINPPMHALNVARQAAALFTELYGPLPYARLVILQADFADGMEFTGMVYVGDSWFTRFNGRDASWLTLITAHEVAHQWWYALVTNDQGRVPYLDEALSIYSEVLYLERFVPDLVPWWWSFRVEQHNPQGFVDSQVYEYWNVRLYINAVYLRGADMLREIRELLGDEAFFGWLRAYLTGDEGRIATPADFWGALGTADYRRTADIRAKYLREPDPLGLMTRTAAATESAGEGDTPSSDTPGVEAGN